MISRETLIEIQPFKGGGCCYEGPGDAPHWVGKDAKQSAVDYYLAMPIYQ